MAMKVKAAIVGFGPQPKRMRALVTVTVEFDGPQETLEIKLLVPNDGDAALIHEHAMVRAKDFALRFAEFPNTKVHW